MQQKLFKPIYPELAEILDIILTNSEFSFMHC